jgi:adenine-specific DNA-methyltransferase
MAKIRYIGSKARIVDHILEVIGPPQEGDGCFVDAFAGTGVVGARAAELGWEVRLNDHLLSSVIVASAGLLGPDAVPFERLGGYAEAIDRLNHLAPRHGFLWRQYSPASARLAGVERRYFTEENAARLDAARVEIELWAAEGLLTSDERMLLIADILSTANSVANIAGTYGCFMRGWLDGALRTASFKPRRLQETTARFVAHNVEVAELPIAAADVAYFDPPYTKRQYAAYYHLLETIAHGDEPAVEGVTGLRPWQDKASDFCYKRRALDAIASLLERTPARRIFLSYSSEGHVGLEELEQRLATHDTVAFHELAEVGRYRPNRVATEAASHVSEFLVEILREEVPEAAAA